MSSGTPAPLAAIWKRHPRSTIYNQRKLLELPESITDPGASTAVEFELAPECSAAIDRLTQTAVLDFDTPMVCAYHLLLQSMLGDEESLLGIARQDPEQPGQVLIGASYAYAEPDEPLDGLIEQVSTSLLSHGMTGTVLPEGLRETLTNAPAFFYECGQRNDISAPFKLNAYRDNARMALRISTAACVRTLPDLSTCAEAFQRLLLLIASEDESSIGAALASVETLRAQVVQRREDIALYQEQIAALWAELLKVARSDIGPDTSYFQLGGTSLNAFKLVNQVRARFEVDLNIREIAEHATLAAFSRYIVDRKSALLLRADE